MIVDALLIIDFSHPWTSTVCHLYSSEVRSERFRPTGVQLYKVHRKSSVSSMIVEKFDHTRIVSNTSFPILKCIQCFFFHQIADTDLKSLLKSSKVSGLLSFC